MASTIRNINSCTIQFGDDGKCLFFLRWSMIMFCEVSPKFTFTRDQQIFHIIHFVHLSRQTVSAKCWISTDKAHWYINQALNLNTTHKTSKQRLTTNLLKGLVLNAYKHIRILQGPSWSIKIISEFSFRKLAQSINADVFRVPFAHKWV